MSADLLSPILSYFNVRARVFYTGRLCGHATFDQSEDAGFLHLLRSGTANLRDSTGFITTLTKPTLVFYPRPLTQWIDVDQSGADLACASVDFEHKSFNPIALALPSRFMCELEELQSLQPLLEILFAEAFFEAPGRQEVLNRLFELVLIQLLRATITRGSGDVGLLRGLAHPQLSRAISAMHAEPANSWPLEELAGLAAMSRSSFAATFKREMGQTPGDYLTTWRISTAQALLLRGTPLKHVAESVGYASQAGFLRAFKTSVGKSPTVWLRHAEQVVHRQP
ncbi:AraC family transcriptional regulator [Rhodanobacter sp. OK091]|uniref:helix-turn-helix transcriptional regulator n=1 Tax=Rhodanobacter sp. OK091 TaxID=1881037 RepID=UPI00091CA013|nr:AraC family transcriptional regulator [Rhodanobacter sp. OK091]SHM16245.1 transcriptional regulator, AraC family [Rhodanobacter sp. OK091]